MVDIEYEAQVDALIEGAYNAAMTKIKRKRLPWHYEITGEDGNPYKCSELTRQYRMEMDRLKRTKGLIK